MCVSVCVFLLCDRNRRCNYMTSPFGDSVVTCLVKKAPILRLISSYLTNNEIREGCFMQEGCLLVCVYVSSERAREKKCAYTCGLASSVQTRKHIWTKCRLKTRQCSVFWNLINKDSCAVSFYKMFSAWCNWTFFFT